jgi:hypothetical protein
MPQGLDPHHVARRVVDAIEAGADELSAASFA